MYSEYPFLWKVFHKKVSPDYKEMQEVVPPTNGSSFNEKYKSRLSGVLQAHEKAKRHFVGGKAAGGM